MRIISDPELQRSLCYAIRAGAKPSAIGAEVGSTEAAVLLWANGQLMPAFDHRPAILEAADRLLGMPKFG